ncbi:TNF receptor-associated factor 6-like isoform X2 [Clytia hemisphaerica]
MSHSLNSMPSMDFSEDVSLQGFDEHFDPPPPDVYECPICLLVLRMPMQTECGHRFCKSCILKVIREGRPNCPIDNERLSENQIFPDNFARREILSLSVRCRNFKQYGCKWHQELRAIDRHMETCDYSFTPCTNKCGKDVQRVHLKDHLDNDCVRRVIECEYCNIKIVYSRVVEHNETCTNFPVVCPNNCGTKLIRQQLKQHMEADCPKLILNCPYQDAGCEFQGSKVDVERHLLDDQTATRHMTQMLGAIKLLTKRVNDQEEELKKASKLSSHSTDIEKMDVDSHYGDTRDSASSMKSLSPRDSKEYATKIKELEIKITQSRTVTEMCRSELKQNKLDMDSKMDGLAKQIQEQNSMIAEVSARVWCGSFTWRITNFENLFQQAKNQELVAIHSQPFYTAVPGYKMCLRVNLNGIDSGAGTHVSMFVHLMQGEFDSIIQWPFSDGLELTIMDQDTQNPVHVKEELFARPTLQAFLRPKTPRNHKGYGYVEMIPHTTLRERHYVSNDTMIVKVRVKSSSSS